MAVKLMSLRDVSGEEAEEIRALLSERRFDYYETPAGNWGISAPMIWLREPEDLDIAKKLLESYQQERSQRIQEEYQQLRERGEQRKFLDEIREYPLRVIALVALAAAVAYFSVVPFIELGQ